MSVLLEEPQAVARAAGGAGRLRLAVWGPLPPSSSGVADYLGEQLGALRQHCDVRVVVEDPAAVDPAAAHGLPLVAAGAPVEADLDLYQIGNSPAHGYVYRAALARPGVVLLHDFVLHHLVLHETLERGDKDAYLREMRRAYGERGSFVGRQVAAALGGDILPALFPLNERLLEGSLAVVALSRWLAGRVAAQRPERRVLHLPHHLALPLDPVPTRSEARRALGLPTDALLVTAPGLATTAKRLDVALRAVARLRGAHPALHLVVAGGVAPHLPLAAWARESGAGGALIVTGRLTLADFVRHLAAADVVLALRFPTHGEMSGAAVRALGVGRAVVTSAGTPPAEEFGEGLVALADPGIDEEASLTAVLDLLLRDAALRESLGRLGAAHVRREHALAGGVARLAEFLHVVHGERPETLAAIEAARAPRGRLLSFLVDETRFSARELGLETFPLGLETLYAGLVGGAR